MKTETAVWGLGNELLGDDAAGVAAARRLAASAPPGWTIVECGTVPENYISTLAKGGLRRLIIIDAADMGLDAGEIRLAALDDAEDVNFSTHGLPLPLILARFADSVEISLIAIEPRDLTPGRCLTPAVAQAVDSVVASLLDGTWRNLPPLHQENRSPR